MQFNDFCNRYQDDWLKTSATSLQFWEKAPLEPYALPKPVSFLTAIAGNITDIQLLSIFHPCCSYKYSKFSSRNVFKFLQINYSVICPDIDPLTSAAADFFQQLGTGQ